MRVFVTAGEASGDKLGAAFMKGFRQLCPDVEFRGIGGLGERVGYVGHHLGVDTVEDQDTAEIRVRKGLRAR